MKEKKELHEELLDFLKTKSSDPEELCTAAARLFYMLMSATIQMRGAEADDIHTAIEVLDLIKVQIVEEFIEDRNDFFGHRHAAGEAIAYSWREVKEVNFNEPLVRPDVQHLLEKAYHDGYINGITTRDRS